MGTMRTLGAALLGAFIGILVSLAASHGFESEFPEVDLNRWSVLIWGEHWLLRMIVSLLSTATGGFIIGIASRDPKLASTLSALPTVALFLGPPILYLLNTDSFEPLSLGWWFTFLIVALLSIPAARWGAAIGFSVRSSNNDLFDRRHRFLGLHWSAYSWIWVPIYLLIAEVAFMTLIWLRVSFSRQWGVAFTAGRVLVTIAAFLVWYGLIKGLCYLVIGTDTGLSPIQVFGRVAASFLLLPSLSILLRLGGFYLLEMREPAWIGSVLKFLAGPWGR